MKLPAYPGGVPRFKGLLEGQTEADAWVRNSVAGMSDILLLVCPVEPFVTVVVPGDCWGGHVWIRLQMLQAPSGKEGPVCHSPVAG